MPSEVSTVTGDHSVEALRRELAEAREQQAAAVEILASISSSVTDANQVFAKIAASAARLCDANDATIFQVDGDLLRRVANNASIPQYETRGDDTMPLTREVVGGRAVLDGKTIQVADVQAEMGEYPEGSDRARRVGHRTILAVPLMRVGEAIGVIAIRRTEVRQFTDRQIALLKTFADQAVIAIENTRLFEAEQARTKELQEALAHQTATTEVLNIISRSPTKLTPVFETIVASAANLCGASASNIQLYDGRNLDVIATHNYTPDTISLFRRLYPMAPSRSQAAGRAILSRDIVQIADTLLDSEYSKEMALVGRFRSILAVPMSRYGEPIGVISISHYDPTPFTNRQIDLLKTFAEQAVIAIQNARLFEEVQSRTRELTEALDYQTATSEVLGVISRSPSDVQPVFDTIVRNSVTLCKGLFSALFQFDGELIHQVAHHNFSRAALEAQFKVYPAPPSRDLGAARAILDCAVVHIPDNELDLEFKHRAVARAIGWRSGIFVPMLKEGAPIGVIMVARTEPGAFADSEIELLKTFADQAVIAIENARLFKEVQARTHELGRSVEELKSLGAVARAVNSSLELKVVLARILEHACAMSEAGGGAIYVFDKARREFELEAGHNMSDELSAAVRQHPIRFGESVVGQSVERRQAAQIDDLTTAPPHPLYEIHIKAGVRSLLAVPLLHQDEVIGALVVRRKQVGVFTAEAVALLQSFADQSAIALENARLFEEIARKSRELEIASQHKSQFVANMSHELRTPLAAILGYAELIQEGFYGALPEKSMDALTRIRSNGKHLLGLINTVLDIAKIESGQFTLNMAEYAIESIVETVRSATESLAQNKKLALRTEVAKSLPVGVGDEQRLTQVLLNLVGNAIKFTDAGEVRVTAEAVNGHFNVSVADTGPGIPEHERARIFEQFHQVDSSLTKAAGGTGLGLAIAKQIVDMHGGRIWVESTLGKGSTFQMELPTRAEFRKTAP